MVKEHAIGIKNSMKVTAYIKAANPFTMKVIFPEQGRNEFEQTDIGMHHKQ